MRELGPDEADAAWDLARLAFGLEGPPAAGLPAPGATRWGAFDQRGRLIGKAHDLHHDQWWGGAALPAADVGGVAVVPEWRGSGTSRALLRRLLAGARERGAAVSSLYPTVSPVYRSAGWSMAGVLRRLDLPTAMLPRHRPDPRVQVRPGDPADARLARSLYTAVARRRSGMLTRAGAPFDPPDGDHFPEGIDGITVVEVDGAPGGFAAWKRGRGYGADAMLTVVDLVATSAPAARALVEVLATWRTVAPTTRFRALPSGLVSDLLPLESALDGHAAPWMHRTVDVVRAVAARPWPTWLRVGTRFALHDELAPWNTGSWELEMAGGAASLTPSTSAPALHLSVEGFGLLYTGRATVATLVEGGLAEVGTGGDPAVLDALRAAPVAELLDYF